MPSKKPFKAVIVGGSIAGLSLANMLQKNGIDYVVLKAYPDIKAGTLTSVFREHNSYLVMGGLHDRVFWFHFFNIGQRVYSPNIPRYTKDDQTRRLKEHENDPIMPGLTFGDLVRNRVTSNMTALPEYAYEKWSYGRIITIGDAAHKFEPITGHGGNSAIETAAVLVNSLVMELKLSSCGTLTASQVKSIFDEVQRIRLARARKLIAQSHEQQRTEAMETPFISSLH
ncbi:hypothetical protein VTN96DRAFT_9891 [Rasamsonia emersonii]|uniref:FAD-binding domain-containing protein n=1 Tax=Rasamsonia emersonii (strain ATCC 16479 / CBS 393.64 / IMI 116815) TaxID=1408163 RepID=A0A0F4YMR7_RASE3|nr:hypothetical protein T310_6642 [Rasamsonia emersonii CBS 393.64]KKA19395.1 hypothetical protein T310_6642 [Rasamsonia emersonii CBS 393.64]